MKIYMVALGAGNALVSIDPSKRFLAIQVVFLEIYITAPPVDSTTSHRLMRSSIDIHVSLLLGVIRCFNGNPRLTIMLQRLGT